MLPVLDAAGIRIVSQSSAADTADQARRLGLSRVPELDEELVLSARLDPAAVPAVFLLDDGAERDRVEGIQRDRLAELAARGGARLELDGLPAVRPGCGSPTRGPPGGPPPGPP